VIKSGRAAACGIVEFLLDDDEVDDNIVLLANEVDKAQFLLEIDGPEWQNIKCSHLTRKKIEDRRLRIDTDSSFAFHLPSCILHPRLDCQRTW
jgi:hypothetical protein